MVQTLSSDVWNIPKLVLNITNHQLIELVLHTATYYAWVRKNCHSTRGLGDLEAFMVNNPQFTGLSVASGCIQGTASLSCLDHMFQWPQLYKLVVCYIPAHQDFQSAQTQAHTLLRQFWGTGFFRNISEQKGWLKTSLGSKPLSINN